MTLSLDGVGGHCQALTAVPPRKDLVPIVQEAGLGGCKKSCSGGLEL